MKCRKRRVCGCLIISIIYICFSIYSMIEYREFVNARIDTKVAIAKELEIDCQNSKKLDKQITMTARHYTSNTYEDIKVTFRKNSFSSSETVYNQLASTVELYDKGSQDYVRYVHILNAIDTYIVYQEQSNIIIVVIGKLNLAILNFFKVAMIIIFLGVIVTYIMSCCWTNRLVAVGEYRKAISYAIEGEIRESKK